MTTYRLGGATSLTELGTVSDGLTALCWVTGTWRGVFYGSNAGSATVTGYTIDPHGVPELVSTTPTDAGPIDLVASPDGSTLYVETGGSDLVDIFSIQPNGSLLADRLGLAGAPGSQRIGGYRRRVISGARRSARLASGCSASSGDRCGSSADVSGDDA